MKVRIRPKLSKLSAPAADDLFPTPASLKVSSPAKGRRSKTPSPKKHAQDKGLTKADQPSLPGLLRRGRPRLKNPVPATQRAASSRSTRVAAGARRIELMLAPEVAASLNALAEHYGEPRAAVVARLITRAGRRLLK